MATDTKLRIYGTVHVLSPESCVDEFREFSRESDAFCIEESRDYGGLKITLLALLRNPAAWVSLWLYGCLLTVVQVINGAGAKGFERALAERVADNTSVKIHPVDVGFFRSMCNTRLWVTPLSWCIAPLLALFSLAFVTGLFSLDPRVALIGLIATFALSMFVFFPFVYSIDSRRNEAMLQNVAEIAAENDYDCSVEERSNQLISRVRRVKSRKSRLVWKSTSSTSLSSVET